MVVSVENDELRVKRRKGKWRGGVYARMLDRKSRGQPDLLRSAGNIDVFILEREGEVRMETKINDKSSQSSTFCSSLFRSAMTRAHSSLYYII